MRSTKSVAGGVCDFDATIPTVFYVFSRRTQKLVGVYKTPPFYCFHTTNAYEDNNGDIIVDLSHLPNNSIIHHFMMQNIRKFPLTPGHQKDYNHIVRFRLANPECTPTCTSLSTPITNFQKLPDAQIDFRTTGEARQELNTINPNRRLKSYRYVYGICNSGRGVMPLFDRIVKSDLESNHENGTRHWIWEQPSCTPSEPIFVPCPNAKEEDEGVVLSVVLDGTRNTSFLLILDAKDLTEVARAELDLDTIIAPDNGAKEQQLELKGNNNSELDALLTKFADSFLKIYQRDFHQRDTEHTIPLLEVLTPPPSCVYRMSNRELVELKKQIQDLLDKEWIRPSTSPYGAPTLFVNKKDGSLIETRWLSYSKCMESVLSSRLPLQIAALELASEELRCLLQDPWWDKAEELRNIIKPITDVIIDFERDITRLSLVNQHYFSLMKMAVQLPDNQNKG
ncbi:uncharacterized protein VTP21DRAFT_5322 [Calcarisporiella thermophila]|uniref:uncharacterized protein n=1 Tax=Calcarisporiella thermophila TaxID=911321 RepID=UPI0037443B06